MTKYRQYHDVKVRVRDGKIEWVDFGQIREIDEGDARWLGNKLINAANQISDNE